MAQGGAAKKGVHYLTADGGRVPNLGETMVQMVTKEQTRCSVKFQVADVQKPILSVGTLAATGSVIAFTKFGGTITNLKTKRKISFKKKGGVYVLEVLVAPGGSIGDAAGQRPASAGSTTKPRLGFTRPGAP